MRYLLLLLLLLAPSAGAADWWTSITRGPDSTQITSLPYTMSTNGTTASRKVYYITGDLSSTGTGITVDCDSCVLNLQGHTITFDADSSGSAQGINVTSGTDYFYCHNGEVTQFQTTTAITYGSYGGSDCDAIYLASQMNWVTFHNIDAHATGYNSSCLDGESDGGGAGHLGIQVIADPSSTRGDFSNYSNSFSSRYTPASYAIKLGKPLSSPDTFNYQIRNIDIPEAPHLGIACGGWAEIVKCTVEVDQRNDGPAGSGNAHGIADAGSMSPGSRIDSCVITCGTAHYGGRGIYLNYGGGTEARPVSIGWNTLIIHSGDPGGGDSPQARGIKMRWGPQWVNIHDNYIEIQLDDSVSTDHTYSSGHGIYIQSDYEQDGSCPMTPYRPMSHIRIYNNDIRVNWKGSRSWEYSSQACCFAVQHLDSSSWAGPNDFNISFNNAYRTLTTAVVLSHDQGCFSTDGNLEGWIFVSDTFIVSNATDEPTVGDTAFSLDFCTGNNGPIVAGWGGGKSVSDARFINPVFIGSTWDSLKSGNGSGEKDLTFERIVKILVVDSAGLPLENAVVNIAKAVAGGQDTLITDTTNVHGWIIDTVATRRYHWSSCTKTIDSTYSLTFSADDGAVGLDSTRTLLPTVNPGDTVPITLELATAGGNDPHRVSIIFVHFSVGTQLLQGVCENPLRERNIIETLDTVTWTDSTASDTARVVFHSYRMNNEGGSPGPLGDTIPHPTNEAGCAMDWLTIDYNLYEGGSEGNGRMSIWNANEDWDYPADAGGAYYAGILTNFFHTDWNNDTCTYGRLFRTHQPPSDFTPDPTEVNGYDLVCIKNPYRCWFDPYVAKNDSVKVLFQALYDTLENHPTIHFGNAFGTPLHIGHNWADTTEAKINWALYKWWADTLVAPANVHKIDTYGPLCETANNAYKYGLKHSYWDTESGSHVNSDGQTAVRPYILAGLQAGVEAIMDERFADVGDTGATPTPPVANFSGTPLSGELPLEVSFTDLSTNTPTSWDWNWGDLTTHGTTQNPTHTYTEAGSYTVTLTATNADGSDAEVKVGYITILSAGGGETAGAKIESITINGVTVR